MAKITRFDAIYARQSVDKKDSVSIEAQMTIARLFVSTVLKSTRIKDLAARIRTAQNCSSLLTILSEVS